MERYKGDLYCADCLRFTVADLAAEADSEAQELRALEGRLADEEPPDLDPDDDYPY
jgi:hypothetical protein